MANEEQNNKIKKGTVYQELNKMLNLDGFGFQDNQPTSVMQQASAPPPERAKIIIKGNSPEEIHKKGLELEQKRELQNKFFRTTDRGFQKALQYEAARLPAYMDYEGMEYYPIISSALDLFMEEATTIGLNGKMLNIYSNKERIKMLLEEFFYDVVNVNVNLPFWVRNTPIKYDSIIPLLNGEEITIKELSERLKKNPNEEIWTYSIQDKTNKIVAGKIIWCDLTRKNSDILKITFDDGTYVETTPDHEYMLRNGSYLRADELKAGISLMPFYTLTSNEANYISGYEKVYNPASNHHVFTHRIVAQECVINLDEENYHNAETSLILNHKVLSIEKNDEKCDVYCMEVVGKNNEQDRHNFPVCSKNENGEYTRNGVFLSNCKYGDNFVLLYGERKKGITHVKQLVNYEIERFERIQNGKPLVKFKERMIGDEFNVFEMAHFRLLGDDKYLPYGSCLLSNSYIKTNNGIKEIKNIVKGDIVFGFDVNTQKKIKSNVLDVVCNGEKQTYKISTQHNYVKATDNHKILIYDYNDDLFKEKFVAELMIGDGLIINNNDDYNELIKINKIVDVKEHSGRIYDDFTNDIKYIPDYIDEDFAKMFGFLLGDGGVNTNKPYMVYFAYGVHDTINKKYINLLEKYSNKKIYLRKNKNYGNGIASAVVNSKSLATILKNMEFAGDSRTKRIPKWLFSASIDIRKAFLEGILDADGCVFIDKWNCKRFTIEMSNYDLVNDIKLLAQSLGYKTGSINKRKKRENIIIKGIKVINIADAFVLYFYESENKQTKTSEIKNRLTNDFIIEKIKSIEKDEIGFVYDIHVDNENHNFYANNIVVHNSVLNKIRRVFRQLVMAEDAMLTYRIIRAGEKKVFKIDVGNIDEDDIEEYIYKVATKFKKSAQVNPSDGQIDYRFNILGNDEDYFLPVRNANTQTGVDTLPGACLALNTKIDLLDGRSLELNDIINEFNSGKELWSYSINPNTGSIVPGKIIAANITRKNTDVLKITLDNGESITCTPDHKFCVWSDYIKSKWKYVEAKDLTNTDSIVALYKEKSISGTKNKKLNNYYIYYNFLTKKYEYVHKMVFEYFNGKVSGNYVIHHNNFNKYNNNPTNLIKLDKRSHGLLHSKYNSTPEAKERSKITMTNNWKNPIFNNKLKNSIKNRNNEYLKHDRISNKGKKILSDKIKKCNKSDEWKKYSISGGKKIGKINIKLYNVYIELKEKNNLIKSYREWKKNLTENEINFYRNEYIINANINHDFLISKIKENNNIKLKDISINRHKILKYIKKYGYSSFNEFKLNIIHNNEMIYNHKIVSIEFLKDKQDTGCIQIENYHNFALSCGIFTKNSNLDAIQDIEYLRDNLFIGLGIPKPFLSFQDAAGAGKNMAQYDIRFSKKINRIQQTMIQELNKMAMVHLYLLGCTGEDLNSFTLTLTNPSTQQELLKSELMRDKAQTYTELTRAEGGIAAMSHTTAKRQIFNMSDREIVDDLKQQKMEKVVMQELQDSPVTIKKSGLFTDIDKRFGSPEEMPISGATGGEAAPPTGGAPAPTTGAPSGGIPPTGGAPIPPTGGAPTTGAAPMGGGAGGAEAMMEDKKIKLSEEDFNKHIEKLVYGSSKETEIKKENEHTQIIQENNKINDSLNNKALNMVNEITNLLENHESINTGQKNIEIQDTEIMDIENIDLNE
jgi:intein/homing endonuclease